MGLGWTWGLGGFNPTKAQNVLDLIDSNEMDVAGVHSLAWR